MPRPPPVPANNSRTTTEPAYETTSVTSPRSLRQLSIFIFGATCFLASTAFTRRAIYRRNLRIKPKFHEPNTNPHEHFSPLHDAIQALNLATMNVFSIGLMLGGGVLWATNTSGLREMQASLRGRLGYDSFEQGRTDGVETIEEPLEAATSKLRKEEENDNGPKTQR